MSGVTNGDSYTFSVTATNSLGTSVASTVSNIVVPAVTVPLAPNSLTATPGNTAVAISWVAPVNGGSAITGYNVYEGTKSGGENVAAPVNGTTLITSPATTVTGLINGHEYYFTVKAVNSIGSSAQSAEVWVIPAGTAPGIATHVTARSGYESATVTWTAPSDSGGSAISHYTLIATDLTATSRGGQSCTWSTGPLTCTLTGLTDGDSYTFAVTATNSVGTGLISVASNAVVPALSVSSPSTALIATPSNGEVALSWAAPAANGGAAVIGYNLYEGTSAGGETYSSPVNGAVLISGTSSAISRLTNGHTYYFTVKAVNAVGSSLASNEAWAIPGATVADAPQAVNAVAGSDGSVVVSWNAPLKSGGSSITGYAVTPYIGTTAQAARIFASTATAETITDLQPGTSYSFTVVAVNGSGTGAQSAPSDVVSLPLAYTRLALSLSAARVTYGHEQAETFSVSVSPTYTGPVPSGFVLVKKSTTTLCVIKLSAAKGSCSLTPRNAASSNLPRLCHLRP